MCMCMECSRMFHAVNSFSRVFLPPNAHACVRASSGRIGSGLRCWRRPHSSFTKGMTSGGIGKEFMTGTQVDSQTKDLVREYTSIK